jgi:hypothetical protein
MDNKIIGLAPDIIVRYFINPSPDIERVMRLGKEGKVNIIVTQLVLMDALNSLKPSELTLGRLVELFQSVNIGGADFELRKHFFIKNKERIKHQRDVAWKDFSETVQGVEIKKDGGV